MVWAHLVFVAQPQGVAYLVEDSALVEMRLTDGCQMGVRWVSDCHSSVHKTHALYNDMSEW